MIDCSSLQHPRVYISPFCAEMAIDCFSMFPVILYFQVATVELIENVTLGIMWKPDLPRSAAPKPGIGQDGNVFPISYPVMFDIGYVKGKIYASMG